jgi:hypothetical protein
MGLSPFKIDVAQATSVADGGLRRDDVEDLPKLEASKPKHATPTQPPSIDELVAGKIAVLEASVKTLLDTRLGWQPQQLLTAAIGAANGPRGAFWRCKGVERQL